MSGHLNMAFSPTDRLTFKQLDLQTRKPFQVVQTRPDQATSQSTTLQPRPELAA